MRWAYKDALFAVVDGGEEGTKMGPAGCHLKICERFDEQELSYLWDSEDKRELIISYLVCLGTDLLLEPDKEAIFFASIVAYGVKALESNGDFHLTPRNMALENDEDFCRWVTAQVELQKFTVDLNGDLERETTRFFSKRNGCKCLREKCSIFKAIRFVITARRRRIGQT